MMWADSAAWRFGLVTSLLGLLDLRRACSGAGCAGGCINEGMLWLMVENGWPQWVVGCWVCMVHVERSWSVPLGW